MTLSALYGKLLVVLGIAFPVAEYFAEDLPEVYYKVCTILIAMNKSFCDLLHFSNF